MRTQVQPRPIRGIEHLLPNANPAASLQSSRNVLHSGVILSNILGAQMPQLLWLGEHGKIRTQQGINRSCQEEQFNFAPDPAANSSDRPMTAIKKQDAR